MKLFLTDVIKVINMDFLGEVDAVILNHKTKQHENNN